MEQLFFFDVFLVAGDAEVVKQTGNRFEKVSVFEIATLAHIGQASKSYSCVLEHSCFVGVLDQSVAKGSEDKGIDSLTEIAFQPYSQLCDDLPACL